MLDAATVKAFARECGADVVGITPMSRFEGAPRQFDPRYIHPGAKSMIVMGVRVLRGTLRGIEEGTFFVSYSGMGYAGLNTIYQPMILWKFCNLLEDDGWEAIPIPNSFPWSGAYSIGRPGERTGEPIDNWSRPVAEGLPAPDVFIQMRIAAYLAGLGEIGWSKMLLTPQFGPRVRLFCVITDCELEPDPVFEGKLCDRCMSCARDCTAQAISETEAVRITLDGHAVEWGKIDHEKCSHGFCGGVKSHNPFWITDEDARGFTAGSYGKTQAYKVAPQNGYGRGLEGARGCMRACMIHLEERKVLQNRFHNPFRQHAPWKLPAE